MKKVLLKYSILFSIVWATIIFILCATPGQYIPSTNWLELLSFDKFVHASIFFILCTLLFIVAIKYNQSKMIIISYFALSVLYGGLLEIMQARCFSHRSGDWLDFFANSFGCCMALLALKKLSKYLKTTN
ncbi:MAG: VanZ family protein [Bacteroidota bacterium]|nr:VanZ family protein [Bacteroidota bacterium]